MTGAPTWATGTGPRGCPAVARDGDERLRRDQARGEEPVVGRGRGQRPALGRLRRQAHERRLAGRGRGPGVRGRQPVDRLRGEIGIVREGATGQEVALDPFDQRLHTALLVAGPRVAGLGLAAALAGQLRESRRPERLSGVVPPARHRLHVAEDQHPRHPAEGGETVDQPAEQGLLAQVGGEAHPGPAAVLQPTGQEVACRRRPLRERELPDLAPVDLQVLRRQPREADWHVGRGLLLLLFQAHPADIPAENALPPPGTVARRRRAPIPACAPPSAPPAASPRSGAGRGQLSSGDTAWLADDRPVPARRG